MLTQSFREDVYIDKTEKQLSKITEQTNKIKDLKRNR